MSLEWAEVSIGRAHRGHIRNYTCSLPHTPIEPATLTIGVYGGSPLHQLAEAADDHRTPIMSTAANRAGALTGDAVGSVNHQTGQCQFSFSRDIPEGAEIIACYQWEPPDFRNCKVKIMTEAGEERYISIYQLADVLRRGCR